MTWLKFLSVVFCVFILPGSAHAVIGKVLGVKQGAEITRSGKTSRVTVGMEVASGDMISTNGSGVVQLIFVDETKIAVGPNARMSLDVTMLRGKSRAKSFAVQALGGSFRFISGNSRKKAYSVKTPTATMAVRGTTFDIWVAPGQQSAVLVLEGAVRMCGQRGACRIADRQCSLFATGQGGQVGRPADQDQYQKALGAGFPFAKSQENLLPPFQVAGEGCSREVALAPPIKPDAPEGGEVREVKSRSVQEAAPKSRERKSQSAQRTQTRSVSLQRAEQPGASASASAGGTTRAEARAGSVSVSVDLSGNNGGGSGTSASASAGGISVFAGTD